ncbi:hypothetical protein DBV15_11096 [Temnothorax longispinosus]|uniref:Uncharacterized protein n=1 Tax=Temnothorax longispinosus TaxID=300112 RepID=A0A4S2JAQ9_9HYME|nr:hypothetical protein DBV15_11096 [Temnothorax longispinosus]
MGEGGQAEKRRERAASRICYRSTCSVTVSLHPLKLIPGGRTTMKRANTTQKPRTVGENSSEEERKNPMHRGNWWKKENGRMRRESGRKVQRKKTGPRVQRDEQSARCG